MIAATRSASVNKVLIASSFFLGRLLSPRLWCLLNIGTRGGGFILPHISTESEQRFFRALAAVRRWRLENGLLHLLGEDGATVIRLGGMG